MAGGVSGSRSAGPALLDAVAVFPGEAGAGLRTEGLLDGAAGSGARVPVLLFGELPGVVGVLGEAVEQPVDGAPGMRFGQAAMNAQEFLEGFVGYS